jgi:Uma2 family endonuclease
MPTEQRRGWPAESRKPTIVDRSSTAYQTIASVKAVVLVSQDEQRITVYEHQPDGRWSERVHADGSVELRVIGCTLPVDEGYEDLPE